MTIFLIYAQLKRATSQRLVIYIVNFFAFLAKMQPELCLPAKETGYYPETIIKSNSAEIFIAHDGVQNIGFMHIQKAATPPYPSVKQHHHAQIVDLFIREDYRSKGIGKALIKKANEWSLENGLKYLELMAQSKNKKAKEFYKK